MNRKESPEEFELSGPYEKPKPGANGEFLVDNEDPGFEILSQAKENWLRRTLKSFLGSSVEHSTYKGFNIFSPPGNWTPVVFQEQEYAGVGSVQTDTPSTRNSTEVTPTLSEAVA